MGAGIALVAARAGHQVIVVDTFVGALERGRERTEQVLASSVKKQRITADEAQAILARIAWCEDLEPLAPCALVIEAIIEDLEAKAALAARLEDAVAPSAVIATNTSSIPVSTLAARFTHRQRVLGLHFFNPAPVMRLVEVVPSPDTNANLVETAVDLMRRWGKTPVVAKDVPGFIVNRVARPFYAEGWKAFEEGVAPAATLDHLYRSLGRFRMGPLELGDLIGHDVNSTAAHTLYSSYFGRTRFHPSVLQAQYAQAGRLGRKTGRGVYDYADDAPKPAVPYGEPARADTILVAADIDRGLAPDHAEADPTLPAGCYAVDGVLLRFSDGRSAMALARDHARPTAVLDHALDLSASECLAYSVSDDDADQAARALISALGKSAVRIEDRPGGVVYRTLLQLANAAADAVRDGVASSPDVDAAMLHGVNYPVGPLTWVRVHGVDAAIAALDAIAKETGEHGLYQCGLGLERYA